MRSFLRPDVLLTALLLAGLPVLFPNAYWFDVAIRIGLAAVAAIGLNVLMGFAGQISIGHAALVGGAAYLTAILSAAFHWPPLLSVLAATAAATLAGYLLAKPMLRLHGHALTIATLGLGIVLNIVLVNETKWTGGPDGMPVPPLTVGTWSIDSDIKWYALVALVLLLAIVSSLNLFGSPAGRALRALNGSEIAAKVSGVDTDAMKVRAFAVSALFAGIAGTLIAHYSGFITPDMSSFIHSVELATMVVVGGRGSTYGAVLGAALITSLPQLLGGFADYEMVLAGLILMGTMIFLRKGIVPSLHSAWRSRRPARGG